MRCEGKSVKTIVFGGTFNPIHLGHLYLIHTLAEQTDYQRLILLPAREPVHKSYQEQVTQEQRLDLIYCGIDDYHSYYAHDRQMDIVVDTCELTRDAASYTYMSVTDIYQRYDIDGTLGVVVGDDLVEGLHTWYRFEELVSLVHFLVITRENEIDGRDTLPEGIDCHWLDVDPVKVSSSHIRELLGASAGDIQELHSLLSDGVLDYILDHELYKEG